MLEQWFLDLDGVRSGPYQTSEVMSLIAEGEVLPHHLISTELKSQNWTTILEWRLHQNRTASPIASPSPSEEIKPIQFDRPSEAKEVAYEVPADSTIRKEDIESKKAEPIIETIPEPTNKNYTSSISPYSNSEKQRDPMAEMFDMLQNSKHKREQKSQQQHSTPTTPTAAPSTNNPSTSTQASYSNTTTTSGSSGFLKTALSGIVVVVIGFFLGQYFQKLNHKGENPELTSDLKTQQAEPTPAPRNTPVPEVTRDLVDHSNEKITIRSRVPVRSEPNTRYEPESAKNTKDMEDIRNLKKELMELKALKEEIRNNAEPELPVGAPLENPSPSNEPGSGDNALIPGINPDQPAQPIETNGENQNPENPGANKADTEIHY